MKKTYKIKRFINYTNPHSLLVICGHQAAQIWQIQNDELLLKSEISEPDPKYTDREGFFMRRSRGKTLGSGSAYEAKDDYVEKKFRNTLHDKLKDLNSEKIEKIYIFAPEYNKNLIKESIPSEMKKDNIEYFNGNYHNQHPFVALKKIKAGFDQEAGPKGKIKEEAKKLLEKVKIFK